MLAFISSCKSCPNRKYASGGVYDCTLAHERIPDAVGIASFCPLPDYPARIIAEQEATIRALRDQQSLSLTVGILSLIAMKLGVTLHPDYLGLTLECENGEKVFLHHDSFGVTEFTLMVTFRDQGKNYRLSIGSEPLLMVEVTREGIKDPRWMQLSLKKK